MNKLRLKSSVLLMGIILLFNKCQPSGPESPLTEKGPHSGARVEASSCNATAPLEATAGSYKITFLSSAKVGTGSVWQYDVEKIDNGGGPLFLSMGCITSENYVEVQVGDKVLNGEGYTNGNGCAGGGGNFLKVTGISGAFGGGPNAPTKVTLKITLNVNVDQVVGTVSSEPCALQPIVTPGCYHVCGSLLQAQCVGLGDPLPLASQTVTLAGGSETYTRTTDGDGTYCFCGIPNGTYTLSAGGQTSTVTLGPDSFDAVVLTVPAVCNGCSFSQGFYFSSPVGLAYSAGSYNNFVVGGKSYTQAEAVAIFKGRAGGSANMSNIFTQCATIKLSVSLGSTTLSGSLATSVNILETYLGGMTKLNGSSLLTNSKLPKSSGGVSTASAIEAANSISLWIDNNHCTEMMP